MNTIFQRVEADVAVSVTDLKKNPNAVFSMARSEAVAILSHNRVVGYVISPEAYDGFLDLAEDLADIAEIDRTKDDDVVSVDLNGL
jgi:antitoxin StbD